MSWQALHLVGDIVLVCGWFALLHLFRSEHRDRSRSLRLEKKAEEAAIRNALRSHS